jgi:hypothetical protein
MQIYTSECGGKKLERVRELRLGVMLSPLAMSNRDYTGIPLALDNGAFRSWRLGYPFIERLFLHALEQGYKRGWKLDFVVCPDMVAKGMDSLVFSMRWQERLASCDRLALAVQDGMTPQLVDKRTADLGFHTLFIGGTQEWKWKMAAEWVSFARDHGMKVHIGRCGTDGAIDRADALGVDSVDSSNIARNDSWDVVSRYQSEAGLFT